MLAADALALGGIVPSHRLKKIDLAQPQARHNDNLTGLIGADGELGLLGADEDVAGALGGATELWASIGLVGARPGRRRT